MDENIPKPFEGVNPLLEQVKILVFTMMQIAVSVVVTIFMAAVCMVAYVMTTIPRVQYGAQFVALFAALLAIALSGGMIGKADYAIHSSGQRLLLKGDWAEFIRTLFRIAPLNPIHDILGLLPALLVFGLANGIIWYHWNFLIPASFVIGLNVILLAFSIYLIPKSGEWGRDEVAIGHEKYEKKYHPN